MDDRRGTAEGRPPMEFTPEQLAAVERRYGRLLLDAGAGSGKTSVLVERFARAVERDGVDPGAILAITFTDKAATEMRVRVRRRLGLSEDPPWILTIHGFCARLLRAHALAVGLDPSFRVLEEDRAGELSDAAFDRALERVAQSPAGRELLAAHRIGELRGAVLGSYRELRAQGERHPRLPPVPAGVPARSLAEVHELARAVAGELGAVPDPGVTVLRVLDLLGDLRLDSAWPGDLPELPGGAGALRTPACEALRTALLDLRRDRTDEIARRVRDSLDTLLELYAEAYTAAKRAEGGVDFDDLELLARDVLVSGRPAEFAHVMVDELQDTNAVQLELVDLVARDAAVFMVGDAQQSIYGFRHADVALFRARGRELEAEGGRLALATNFRTRSEILTGLNAGFAGLIEDGMALAPGRVDAPAHDPRIELIVADKTAEWERDEGLATPWRAAEARGLAARVGELVSAGEARPADVVVLTRASTDLAVYERALEAVGIPTFVVGGRGLWSHPQVIELVAYLRALANPLDQDALWTVFLSPLCGLSLDGLVLLAAGAEDRLELTDAGTLARFEAFFAAERRASLRVGPEALVDRALDWSGYERRLAARPDGQRRLANLRKLMRLAREWEADHGPDLAGFVARLARRGGAGAREAEAPVESETLDAVRLMTIHRSKGLEFEVVCVADLGRGPTHDRGMLRLGTDGRIGLRVSAPGVGARLEALSFGALKEEALTRDRAEQRRLFYVAMTRARERLILSGAVRAGATLRPESLTPIEWILPAFGGLDGVSLRELSDTETRPAPVERSRPAPPGEAAPPAPPQLAFAPAVAAAVETVSYSGLALYERCGLRFHAERGLAMAPVAVAVAVAGAGTGAGAIGAVAGSGTGAGAIGAVAGSGTGAGTGARARGIDVHARLAAGDFSAFGWNETFARVRADPARRCEQAFAFTLGGTLVTGAFDVLATESDRTLVVDYKSDALAGREPEAVVAEAYELQRLIYALAALRTGARRVEVVHLFLERPHDPAAVVLEAGDRPTLEDALTQRMVPLLAGHFHPAAVPHRGVCAACPLAGTACPVPAPLRTRSAPGPEVPSPHRTPARSGHPAQAGHPVRPGRPAQAG